MIIVYNVYTKHQKIIWVQRYQIFWYWDWDTKSSSSSSLTSFIAKIVFFFCLNPLLLQQLSLYHSFADSRLLLSVLAMEFHGSGIYNDWVNFVLQINIYLNF